jgi:hypothetical protein
MRITRIMLAAAGLIVTAAPGTAEPAPAAEAAPAAACATSEGLFVQTFTSGTYDGKVLRLKLERPKTLYFADRPQRIAGDVPVDRFLSSWDQGADSFAANPPNASLAYTAGGKPQAAVVELSAPKLEGADLSYQVRLLSGTIPASFDDASLFIDAGGLMQLVAYGAQ